MTGENIAMEWQMNKFSFEKNGTLRRIVCAAVQAKDGEVITGIRHFSPDMKKMINLHPSPEKFRFNSTQGFVDQFGDFWNRQDAWKIAQNASQIYRRCGGDEGKLFSENLY